MKLYTRSLIAFAIAIFCCACNGNTSKSDSTNEQADASATQEQLEENIMEQPLTITKHDVSKDDIKAIEKTFSEIEPINIAINNWPDQFPYSPKVQARLFHNGEYLMVKYDVEEQYTKADTTEDLGPVYKDSTVEMFISVDGKKYYNFETNCIGTLLFNNQEARNVGKTQADAESLKKIERISTYPHEAFSEIEGDNKWSLILMIPADALYKDNLKSWDGVKAKGNFYKCGDDLSHPHYLTWAPINTPNPDYHRPEFFQEIIFE